jgi:vacuolar protein sorting-associated protein VTA1
MASTNTDVDIPSDSVPQELKSTCEQILKRARELRKADPVMSYWCQYISAHNICKGQD